MEGIVINTLAYKEKSKLVYLYTQHGKESVKVHDVASKIGFTTTLNIVEYEVSAAKLPTLINYSIKKSYFDMYDNLAKMDVVMTIINLINSLEPDAPHERIYPFLIKILDRLVETANPHFILALFLVKMLSVFGVRPILKNCVKCGNPKVNSFSVVDGGALCPNCSLYDNKEIYDSWLMLYYDRSFDESIIKQANLKELLDTIYDYYSIHTNLRLKRL